MHAVNYVSGVLTLSLMVGRSRMTMKRKATTGRIHRREVRKMVSHMFGWFREFLAVPAVPKAPDQQSQSQS